MPFVLESVSDMEVLKNFMELAKDYSIDYDEEIRYIEGVKSAKMQF